MSKVFRDYRLMSLQLGDDGIAFVNCIASDLALDEAVRFVRNGLAATREVLFAGHPSQFALWLDVQAGESNGWNTERRLSLEDTATIWLHTLRTCGALAFNSLSSGNSTRIGHFYGCIPPLLLNYLHGQRPDVDFFMGSFDPEEMTSNANVDSALGLLRENVDAHCFSAWLREVKDEQRLEWLLLPLFGQATYAELAQMNLRFAAWWRGAARRIGSYLVCPVHMVAVDRAGRLTFVSCESMGLTSWSTEAMWAVLSNTTDPLFAPYRNVAKASPLQMPGRMDGLWACKFQQDLHSAGGTQVFPRSFRMAIESASRAARFSMRVELLSSLDMEAFELAYDMQQYNFLTGDAAVEAKRNRCQAARIVPLLVGELAAGSAPKSRQAIDQGSPLFPAVAEDLSVAVWVAKRLPAMKQHEWYAAGLECFCDVRDLAFLIEQCGPAAPRLDLSAILALQSLLRLSRELTVGSVAQGLLRQLLLGMASREAVRAGWPSVSCILGMPSHIGIPAKFGDRADARQALHDYLDFVIAAIRSVNQNKLALWQDEPQGISTRMTLALVQLMKGLTLSDLQRQVSRWHGALKDLDGTTLRGRLNSASIAGDDVKQISADDRFRYGDVGPLFEHHVLPRSGCHIDQLLGMEDLWREGVEMQHCVLSYAPRAARRQSLIVRLRHPGGIKRATLELRYVVNPGGGKWNIEQAKALCNQKPDVEISLAVDECIQYINHITNQLPPARLAPYAMAASLESSSYPAFVLLETFMDTKRGRRWIPGNSSMSSRARLERAFEASSKSSILRLA